MARPALGPQQHTSQQGTGQPEDLPRRAMVPACADEQHTPQQDSKEQTQEPDATVAGVHQERPQFLP